MEFSENLTSFENWTFRPTLADSWITEAFARDTEISLTKALQKSLSNHSETLTTDTPSLNNNNNNNVVVTTTNNSSIMTSSYPFGFKPDPTLTGSGSDQDALSSKSRCRNNQKSNGRGGGGGGGKITKRKSRASKRSPTTFITADPSNFRQMVQQVTGIRFGNPQFPVIPVLKPEPQRPGNRIQNNPPLHTSTFHSESNNYNNQAGTTRAATQGNVTYGHVAEVGGGAGGSGLDFGTFQSFPTLESWRVM